MRPGVKLIAGLVRPAAAGEPRWRIFMDGHVAGCRWSPIYSFPGCLGPFRGMVFIKHWARSRWRAPWPAMPEFATGLTLGRRSGSAWRISALLFRDRSLVLIALSGFGAMWGTWGFAFWASTLMIKGRHLSAIDAGSIVAMFGTGAIVSKPLIGILSDRLGRPCAKFPWSLACCASWPRCWCSERLARSGNSG